MSTYEDNLLAARFAALAPEPLAGNWNEVLDRAGARKDRRRLGQPARPRAGLAGSSSCSLSIALVAIATASAFAVRAFVLDKGFIGLPPVGATPSTPESGVLEMYYWVHDVRGRTRNWVYADGRLIRRGVTRDNGTPLPGFREQRLTLEGVELLRSEIMSAGGFGHAQPPPGSEPLHNANPPTIQIRRGDRLVPLTWASNLKRLEARLTDPDSWLPASAWKQRKIKAAYVPSRFEVCAAAVVGDPPDLRLQQMSPARMVALLPAGSPERAPRQGLECKRGRAGLFRSDDRGSALARQGSRRRGACKEGPSELQIQCPRPEPTGLDRLQSVPPARRDHLLGVRMSSSSSSERRRDGVAIGTWTVVRGTGQHAQVTGGGRSGYAGLGNPWLARQEGFLTVP